MIAAGSHEISHDPGERVFEHLMKSKGNPKSIKEIANELHLDERTVLHAIHSIQLISDLCEDRDGFYFPENKMRWWLAAFGLVIMCAYTFCSMIKFYHL